MNYGRETNNIKGVYIMFYKMLYGILCNAYKMGLRDLISKAIDDPSTDWDDLALGIMDKIFNYEG